MMDREKYSETTLTLLEQIAKYSGFASATGLFYGKTGTAILLYHGSRFFRSSGLELVADSLIDDIVQETEQINVTGFPKGLTGIAWGIEHLRSEGFVSFNSDWFDDIDRIILNDGEIPNTIISAEYSYMGLYILSRFESASDKSFWTEYSETYFDRMIKLVESKERIFIENSYLLIPFFYFLFKWREYCPNQESTSNIKKSFKCLNKIKFSGVKSINDTYAKYLYQKVFQEDFLIRKREKLTISEMNTVFFNKLLYPEISIFSEEILCRRLSSILEDKKIIKDLAMFLNHKTTGLTHCIPCLCLGMLNCKGADFNNEISAL